MPSTRLIRRGLGAALLCLVLAAPLAAQDTTATRTAAVTYLAGTSVYVGAGRDAGVAEGTLLTVFRGAATIATLKVVFLSSRQASCEVVSATGEIQLISPWRLSASSTPRMVTVRSWPPSSR